MSVLVVLSIIIAKNSEKPYELSGFSNFSITNLKLPPVLQIYKLSFLKIFQFCSALVGRRRAEVMNKLSKTTPRTSQTRKGNTIKNKYDYNLSKGKSFWNKNTKQVF